MNKQELEQYETLVRKNVDLENKLEQALTEINLLRNAAVPKVLMSLEDAVKQAHQENFGRWHDTNILLIRRLRELSGCGLGEAREAVVKTLKDKDLHSPSLNG